MSSTEATETTVVVEASAGGSREPSDSLTSGKHGPGAASELVASAKDERDGADLLDGEGGMALLSLFIGSIRSLV